MSCEESYLAIRRYLSDEREPYAPGTHGNTKRKIRKAAACYVVRNGTLYYQRRQKGLDEFTELEVVLQAGRRKELIDESHIVAGGEHLNQHHTWESISQKYWWRGILKQVKDYMRQCSQCQNRQDRRGLLEEDTGPRLVGRPGRRRRVTTPASEEEEEEEEEEEGDDEMDFVTSVHHKTRSPVAKHELVFVDSKGVVKQYLPRHGQTMLDKLNQQRLNNQFCDITLLIEGEEHRAHKAVLAACSDYFNELFIEKGAVSSHEAVVDLSGFSKVSFLPLLEFAYTSNLCFNFCVMADVATLARHLLMAEVLQICESVHKKVEEQKLMVYQQGDIHTVVSSQPAPQQAPNEDPGAYIMTIGSDGHAVVTHTGLAGAGEDLDSQAVMANTAESFRGDLTSVVNQALGGEPGETMTVVGEAGSETVTLVTHSSQARVGESVTLFSPTGETETMTVVTHSGQAGASESLAVVSACLALEQQPQDGEEGEGASPSMEPGAFLISVDPGNVAPTEVVHLAVVTLTPQENASTTSSSASQKAESAPQASPKPPPAPQLPKRKRGRPAKVKQEVVEEPPVDEEVPEPVSPPAEEIQEDMQGTHDPYKRRLRQRSVGEGGYVRLHMGLEKDPAPPQLPNTPKKRGGGAKRPVKVIEAAATLIGMETVVQTDMEEILSVEGVADGAEPITEQAVGEWPEHGPAHPDGGSEVEGEHVCSECGLSFQRRYALIMHTLKHEKTRRFKCSLCNKEFQYAASLRAHLTRHKHQKSQRPPLVRVPQPYGEEGLEVDGRTKGRTKREFVCDICGKTLPKLYSLRIHMLNHTGVRPHSCRVCGKTFAHKHSLKMHRGLHDAVKQFHCLLCDKSFVSKRSLEEHTSIHTGESKYLCTQCGRSFHRASGLSKHLKRHQPRPDVRGFPCSHCDRSFFEAKDLQQHMNKHLGLKPFQCQICGKSYSWKKDWYSHVKSHSVAEPYRCTVCGKEFFEKALFRRHVKKATHGKKGRVKQNLERECEHCGRKFTQLREYRRHMNNHQGVKPFECLTCGVAWADARSLKRHVRTHTGERPYVCPECQEAHIDARSLRKHMTKYHGDLLPGKIMLEKDTLQFHNQGTQVEHAVSILASDLPPELRPVQPPPAEEIETVLITEETVEAVQAVQGDGVTTLSDQSIMQVVNYVLSQQCVLPGGVKMEGDEGQEVMQTMEQQEVIQTVEQQEGDGGQEVIQTMEQQEGDEGQEVMQTMEQQEGDGGQEVIQTMEQQEVIQTMEQQEVIQTMEQQEVIQTVEQQEVIQTMEQQEVIQTVEQQEVIQTVEQQEVMQTVEQQEVIQTVEQQEVMQTVEQQEIIQTVEQQEVIQTMEQQEGDGGQEVIQTVEQQEVIQTVEQQEVIQTVEQQEVIQTVEQQEVMQTVEGRRLYRPWSSRRLYRPWSSRREMEQQEGDGAAGGYTVC
ncbi:zinc finger and BTB domain-containing protein 11-like isoform X5 [Oncorhynchus tshawytscha]|uniref:zinc finger and BTB domain-containing protein 11-like isoform X5 n=1 Tax=Oncorhynchus tshawytscha TaxID=74940 RepID=UPI001C3DE8BD|nr:zinc finger and BTB domain-containing protein 11-like isoform X5 [Oncorhynchus tshawytscha]